MTNSSLISSFSFFLLKSLDRKEKNEEDFRRLFNARRSRERFVYILNVCFMASITLEEGKKRCFEEKLKEKKFDSRLNQQKLSNKISFYYPFIKFIEDIDLTTNTKKERTDDTSNPLALIFFASRPWRREMERVRWAINTVCEMSQQTKCCSTQPRAADEIKRISDEDDDARKLITLLFIYVVIFGLCC